MIWGVIQVLLGIYWWFVAVGWFVGETFPHAGMAVGSGLFAGGYLLYRGYIELQRALR